MMKRLFVVGIGSLLFATNLCSQSMNQDTAQAIQWVREAKQATQDEAFDKAKKGLEEAMKVFKRYEFWEEYLETKNELAHLYNKKFYTHGEGELLISERIALEVIEESRRYLGKESAQEGIACATIGWRYLYTDFPEKAQPYFEQRKAIHIKNNGSDNLQMGVVYYDVANIAMNTGEYDQAIEYFQLAADVFKKYADKDGDKRATFNYVNACIMLALCYNAVEAPNQALPFAIEAQQVAEQKSSSNRSRMAFVYETLGATFRQLDDARNTLLFLNKAVDVCEEKPENNRPILARICRKISDYFHWQGKPDKAIEYVQKAQAYYDATEGDYVTQRVAMLSRLGVLMFETEQTPRALEYFDQALTLYQKTYSDRPDAQIAENYYDIACYYHKTHNYPKAIEQLSYAAAYNEVRGAVDLRAVASSDFGAMVSATPGRACFSQHLALSVGALYAACLYEMALQENKTDGLFAAQKSIDGALALINELRTQHVDNQDKTRMLERFRFACQTAFKINWALYQREKSQQYLDQAFAVIESNKSTLLMETLQSNQLKQSAGIPDSLSQKEQLLRLRIAQYEQKLTAAQTANEKDKIETYKKTVFNLKSEYTRLQKQLQTDYAAYYEAHYKSKNTTIADVQAFLGDASAFVEYFVADETIYAFCIEKAQVRIVAIDFKDLDKQTEDFRHWLTSAQLASQEQDMGLAAFGQRAHHFYQKMVAPLALHDKIQHLVVVPDGALSYIPFEALLTKPVTSGASYANLDYLLKDYAVQYGFSAALLLHQTAQTAQNRNASQQLLAFAASYPIQSDGSVNRDYQLQRLRSALQDLPAAQREVQQLEQLMQGKFFYKDEASEANFKRNASDFQIIHLAMHGFLDTKNPMNSALVFTENGDSTEDNMLYAYELANMQLQAQLVVLSACETGYGKFQYGEGVMSVARSFVYAGVPSLAMSLWQVNDQATSALMNNFYAQLTQDKNKSEALRQAKLQYLQEAKGINAHPALWAAFVVTGNDQPVQLQTQNNTAWWLWVAVGGGIGVVGCSGKKKEVVLIVDC